MSRAEAGRDIALQLILRISNLALGVVTTIVLVRALGDDGFGQWATIFAIVGLAGSFGTRGLNNVAVERAAAEPEDSMGWVGGLVTLRVLLAPPLTIASLVVALVVADGTAMEVAAVLVHTVLLTSAIATSRIVFQLQVRNASVGAVELGSGIAWGLAVLLVAALGYGLVAMALAFAIVTNATNLVQVWLSHRVQPIRLRGSRRYWRPLIQLGLPVALASLLTMGYSKIDQVLVFELAGDAEAGLYGAAYRIYERLHVLPSTLMTTLFPILVAARRESAARAGKLFNTCIDYLVLVSLPALTIVLAGPEQLTVALFGEEFRAAADALPVLMATFVIVSLGHLTGYLVISYQLQRPFVLVALGALVFNVGANLVLIPEFGFIAAAWLTLATEVLVLAVSMTLVTRRMHVRPTGTRLVRISAAAVAAGLLALSLRVAGVPTLVWAALAAASYPGLLVALGAVRMADVRALRWRS